MKRPSTQPLTRQDFFRRLDRHLTREEQCELAASPEESLGDYHFGLGLWIRNTWIHHGDGSLAAAFSDDEDPANFHLMYIFADGLSTLVITEYRQYLREKHPQWTVR